MNPKRLRSAILETLKTVAPDADVDAVDPKGSFHEQFGIDSVDFMNLMLALEKKLGVSIPDVDYPKLSSLEGCLGFLSPLVGEDERAGNR